MRIINEITISKISKAFYGGRLASEPKNKHRSFNEMIQWRRNREKAERLQRNKKLMVMLKRDINPRFQLADVSAYSLPAPDMQDAPKNWKDLGIRDELVEGLVSGLKLKSPLPAQIAAIPALLSHQNQKYNGNASSLFSAPTGCGKTLIYLLPLFECLKRDEELNGRSKGGPRALILVPTHELVRQVYRSAKALSYYSKLRVETVDSLRKFKDSTPIDILISTPRAVLQKDHSSRTPSVKLGSLKSVIVDEADTLFSAGFADEVKEIILAFSKQSPERVKIVATSATITRQLHKSMLNLFPDLKVLTAQGLHSPPPILKQRFHLISQPGNAKMQLALQIISKEPTSRLLVFCNKLSKAESLHKFLCDSILEMRENQPEIEIPGLPSIFHGNLPPVQRAGLIEKFNTGEIRVLICTDLAARGLDMPLVNHVINFDFPRSLQDYLHRAGRTARAGKGGSVTSFVTAKDRALYEYIQLAAKQKRILSEPLKT